MLKKRLIYSLIILVLFSAIFILQRKVNTLRDKNGLQIENCDPAERVPFLLLGGFRSIAIDLLWVRSIARHQEKKYYETMAINDLIVKLQPDFPDVWTFQAWNMAYNISHEWRSPENKWKWIKAGITFAKKGVVKNPNSADLAFEIGFMYFHLFNTGRFKHADYYCQKLEEEWGENNFEQAAFWFKKAILHESNFFNASVMHRMICHSFWRAALQVENDGRLNEALNYIKKSVEEWNIYLKRYPDDPLGKAEKFLLEIEKKRIEILEKM